MTDVQSGTVRATPDSARRIGLVSHVPARALESPSSARACRLLGQYALTLARQGRLNYWLCSPATLEAIAAPVAPIATELTEVPATCRHVVPLRPYRFAGSRLFCLDRDLWPQRDRHTRLFTLLGLLQRELPSTVLHAWGAFLIAYATVYTAGFLGLPAVITYDQLALPSAPTAAFEWRWVAQRVALALVHNQRDRHRLLTTSDLPPARVRLLPPGLWSNSAVLEALYQQAGARHPDQRPTV